MNQVAVGSIEKRELPAVVDLLARAMRDNPTSIGMFGPDPERRLRSLRTVYGVLLSDLAQPPLVARWGGRVVGAAAVSPPEACFYRRSQARTRRIGFAGRSLYVESPRVPWRHLPGLLRIGLPALGRIATMTRAGSAHDPAHRHWHIELVGVDPELQGQGIGGKLMEAALGPADEAGEEAYLETDTPENVAFYRRRGFEVTGQEEPLQVRTWYMERPPTVGPTT